MKIMSNINPTWGHGTPGISLELAKKSNTLLKTSLFALFFGLTLLYFNLAPFTLISDGLITSSSFDSTKIKSKVDDSKYFYNLLPVKFYHFKEVKGAFYDINLSKVSSFSKSEFETMILSTLRPFLRKRLTHLISYSLDIAMKYNTDPFWVLAVMGTESHYNTDARSCVDAYGLMQIMPSTAHFISKLLKKSKNYKYSLKLRNNTEENIEMGVFYLGKLLKTFDGSHRLATTAYNMGPNGVRRRLKRNLPVGVRNNYLDKVRKFYQVLSSSYIKAISEQKIKRLDLSRQFEIFSVASRF